MSGIYAVSGTFLSVQLVNGSGAYPALVSPGTCTGTDGAPIADCSVYVKMS